MKNTRLLMTFADGHGGEVAVCTRDEAIALAEIMADFRLHWKSTDNPYVSIAEHGGAVFIIDESHATRH